MQMLHSLGHLFSYSWAFLVSALDTTTFAIILSALIIVSFSAQILFKWWRGRRQGTTVIQVLKERLGQSVMVAIYQEQKQLRGRIHDLRQEKEKEKTKVDSKAKEIDGLKAKTTIPRH